VSVNKMPCLKSSSFNPDNRLQLLSHNMGCYLSLMSRKGSFYCLVSFLSRSEIFVHISTFHIIKYVCQIQASY
jgi:hypothetical protein